MNRVEAGQLAYALRPLIINHCQQIHLAGSWRRGKLELGDLDHVVVDASVPAIVDALRRYYRKIPFKVLRCGEKLATVVAGGVQIEFLNTTLKCLGAAMLHATGSARFNEWLRSLAKRRGMKLNQYGLFREDGRLVASATEEEIFMALGLAFIEPEKRNGPLGTAPAPAKRNAANVKVAFVLRQIADAYTDHDDPWRSRSFAAAAIAVSEYPVKLDPKRLPKIPGIGPSIEAEIISILRTGESMRLAELK